MNKYIALSKDAKHAHRLWSNWVLTPAAVIAFLEGIHLLGMNLLPAWREVMPAEYFPWVTASLITLGQIARHLRQHCLSHPEVENEPESN